MSTFQYSPIDLATDAIRLVRLIRGSNYDPIVCEMFETFLHQVDGTPYEALSYTWGKPQEFIEITLCGKRMAMRDNLFTALSHLRRPDEDRLLWIDAICIDQESHLEKGHQVGQMRLIYENAQNVHIWLGKSTEDIDILMTQMNQLDKRALRRPDYRRNSLVAWEREWPILREELDKLGASHTFHERRCRAARNLLDRPWFRRVWIIQEVFSAKVGTVGCGWNILPTRTFVLMPKLLGLGDTIDEHIQAVLEIMPGYLRQRSWHSQRPTLHTLIRKFVSCEATDPRDRVYALIGISSDAGSDGKLQPDYDIGVTMANVIYRTMSYILFPDGCHNSVVDLPPWDLNTLAKKNSLDLPKEVLDWALEQHESETTSRLLLGSGIDVNCPLMDNEPTLLIIASWPSLPHRWGEVTRSLLENPRVDVNITARNSGDSPLHRAVASRNIEMVRLLVRHSDIDINQRNNKGKTPLWVAVATDTRLAFNDIVAVLLGHPKLDLNYGGGAALREALGRRKFSVAAMILQDSRVEVSSLKEHYGFSWMRELLGTPAEFGSYEVLNRALELIEGSESSLVERALSSALVRAASNNQVKVVKLLLERISKEPKRPTILGAEYPLEKRTALHAAVNSPAVDINPYKVKGLVELLLWTGVPIDKKDSRGRTALWIASGSGKDCLPLVDCLLKHGADVNIKNGLGESAVWAAAYQGDVHTVRLLVEGGADIHGKDQLRRWAPLFAAAWGRHEEVVTYLLKAGAKTHEMREAWEDVTDPSDLIKDTTSYVAEIAVKTGTSTSTSKGTDKNGTGEPQGAGIFRGGLAKLMARMGLGAPP